MMQKTYWAIVKGQPSELSGLVKVALEKVMLGKEEKVVVREQAGGEAKRSITFFRSVLQFHKLVIRSLFPLVLIFMLISGQYYHYSQLQGGHINLEWFVLMY
jgi:23S rRNA-/tRNA-specific pseudouridylate synthase